MGKKAEQPKLALKKGDRFIAYDTKGRLVRGLVMDVHDWSRWPIKCDANVEGIRQIVSYSAAELDVVTVLTNQGGSK